MKKLGPLQRPSCALMSCHTVLTPVLIDVCGKLRPLVLWQWTFSPLGTRDASRIFWQGRALTFHIRVPSSSRDLSRAWLSLQWTQPQLSLSERTRQFFGALILAAGSTAPVNMSRACRWKLSGSAFHLRLLRMQSDIEKSTDQGIHGPCSNLKNFNMPVVMY